MQNRAESKASSPSPLPLFCFSPPEPCPPRNCCLQNRAESEASSRAVDSLINYETVKYFNNERHEVRQWSAVQLYCVRQQYKQWGHGGSW